jgi:hypothetical protein
MNAGERNDAQQNDERIAHRPGNATPEHGACFLLPSSLDVGAKSCTTKGVVPARSLSGS